MLSFGAIILINFVLASIFLFAGKSKAKAIESPVQNLTALQIKQSTIVSNSAPFVNPYEEYLKTLNKVSDEDEVEIVAYQSGEAWLKKNPKIDAQLSTLIALSQSQLYFDNVLNEVQRKDVTEYKRLYYNKYEPW